MELFGYTGNIKRLKEIGYEFEKHYKEQLEAYRKINVIMYPTSSMKIEITDLNPNFRTKFIQHILDNKDNPKTFWVKDVVFPLNETVKDTPIWVISDSGNIMTQDDYFDKRTSYLNERNPLIEQRKNQEIPYELYEERKKEVNQKHKEFINPFPTEFTKEIVAQILELDDTHPLELV